MERSASDHVKLYLSNELGKKIKCKDLLSILSLSNEFNILKNAGAQMLDYIYYMTLKLFATCIFL